MCRFGRCRYLRWLVALLALWCGACATSQTRKPPDRHAYPLYDRPSEVDVEPVRPTGNSRYRQPRMADRYQYDETETDLATPLPSSPEMER